MSLTMINPKTKDIVVTNEKFKRRWERLGFVEARNVIPLGYKLVS